MMQRKDEHLLDMDSKPSRLESKLSQSESKLDQSELNLDRLKMNLARLKTNFEKALDAEAIAAADASSYTVMK